MLAHFLRTASFVCLCCFDLISSPSSPSDRRLLAREFADTTVGRIRGRGSEGEVVGAAEGVGVRICEGEVGLCSEVKVFVSREEIESVSRGEVVAIPVK